MVHAKILIYLVYRLYLCRIREAKKEGVPVIAVDGSYLTRKIQKLQDSGVNTAPLEPPSIPPAGWEVVSPDNYKDFTDKIPQMMQNMQLLL